MPSSAKVRSHWRLTHVSNWINIANTYSCLCTTHVPPPFFYAEIESLPAFYDCSFPLNFRFQILKAHWKGGVSLISKWQILNPKFMEMKIFPAWGAQWNCLRCPHGTPHFGWTPRLTDREMGYGGSRGKCHHVLCKKPFRIGKCEPWGLGGWRLSLHLRASIGFHTWTVKFPNFHVPISPNFPPISSARWGMESECKRWRGAISRRLAIGGMLHSSGWWICRVPWCCPRSLKLPECWRILDKKYRTTDPIGVPFEGERLAACLSI